MIGFVVVTHGLLGQELVNTAEFILGRIEARTIVSITGQDSPDDIRSRIVKAAEEVDDGSGVVILTDMFGGTPSNISLSLLAEGRIDVLTGVNLPMIIKLVQSRDKMSLAELAQAIGDYGRRSITVAGEVLSRRPKG